MMRLFCIGFAGGAALLQQQAVLPAWNNLLLALLIAGCMAALFRWLGLPPWLHKALRHLLVTMLGAASGFFWAALLAHLALQPSLHAEDEGRDLRVIGLIESLPYQSGKGQRFNFRIEQVLTPTAHAVPGHIALGWYAANGQHGASPLVMPSLHAGQRWQLTVRLQRPHGNANPSACAS